MKIKYSRTLVMGVMGIFSVLLFALALAQSVVATTIGTNLSTDGTLTVNGNTTLGNATTDTLTIQGATTITTTATDTLNILTGNLKVGNGTPGLSLNTEDAYVEGTFEVDGNISLDGIIVSGINLSDTAITTDITFQNSETLDNNTDGQFMFGRNDTGIVTITAKDNNTDAALTVTPGGAAALTLGTTGAGNTTSITLATDSTGDAEVVLPTDAISTGEILDNTLTATDLNAIITFADADLVDFGAILNDDAAAQGLRLPNVGASPSDITGTNEGYIGWDQTGNRLLINDGTSWGAVVGATTTLADDTADALDIQEGVNNYVNVNTSNSGAVVQFGNATTNPSFSFLGSGSVTTTGSLLTRATADITTASNEALTITADGTGDVVLSSDADTNIQVSASAAPGVDMIAVTNTGQGITTANIDTFQVDLATATGAGANNSALHANILNAPIDASDVINGLEITSVAETVASTTLNLALLDPAASGNTAGTLNALKIDGLTAGDAAETAISIGSGWDTDLNFVDTSPIISIGSGGTIVINDGTATNNLISLADAGAISIGSTNVGTTTISLVTDSTGDGELVVPNESISAAEITNVARSVNLPLTSFLRMDDSDTALVAYLDTDESGNTNEPNLNRTSDVISIIYDITTVDVEQLGTNFRVPVDYASGGEFRFTALKQSANVANTETISARVARQTTGSAEDTSFTDATATLANNTNVQYVTSSPVETYAAGDAFNLTWSQNNLLADDVVEIYAVEFVYTATQ